MKPGAAVWTDWATSFPLTNRVYSETNVGSSGMSEEEKSASISSRLRSRATMCVCRKPATSAVIAWSMAPSVEPGSSGTVKIR